MKIKVAHGVYIDAPNATAQKAAKAPAWQGVIAYFSSALLAVAGLSRAGAAKHNNGKMPTAWRDYPTDVYADAQLRHILEEGKGNMYDPETHMLHAVHGAWNALARLEKLLEQYPLMEEQVEPQSNCFFCNGPCKLLPANSNGEGSCGPAASECQPSVRDDETKSTFGRLA